MPRFLLEAQDVSLSRVDGRDFFTKDIEDALLRDEVDLAVHSLKDLATDSPPGLATRAVLERADPRDALVTDPGRTLASLPERVLIVELAEHQPLLRSTR